MSKTWRDIARPIIQDVIRKHPGFDNKELKKLISKEYPFGARQYHPYKIWLDEIKVQLKEKNFGKKNTVPDKNQQFLINE